MTLPTPFYERDGITIYVGDNREVLPRLDTESVSAVVSDPPSGISFMNANWDSHKGGRDQWIAWLASVLSECKRVMLPGAHALIWALPRTSGWTSMSIEDAGLDVRDCITHLFGSGFPKSHDVSKAIDKMAGAEREVVGVGKTGGGDRTAMDAGTRSGSIAGEYDYTAPATPEAEQWQGWGTALKPGAEFWYLARKPLRSADINVLEMVYLQLREQGVTGDIAWKSERASGAGKRDQRANSSPTDQPQVGGTSASPAVENGTPNTGQPIERKSASPTQSGEAETPNTYGLTSETLTENLGSKLSLPTVESVPVAEKENSTSLPSTTSTAVEHRTESQSTARSTTNCDGSDIQTATEFSVGIAIGPQGSTETVRITRDADGLFIWPDALPKTIKGKNLTVAANVLQHGTGAINVDACRIGPPVPYQPGGWHHDHTINDDGWKGGVQAERPATGRWPANVILDEAAAEALDAQSGVSTSKQVPRPASSTGRRGGIMGETVSRPDVGQMMGHNDTGGASRFFKVVEQDENPCNHADFMVQYDCNCEAVEGDEWVKQGHQASTQAESDTPLRRDTTDSLSGTANGHAPSWHTSTNGSSTTAPSLTAIKSTTSTATSRTTGSRTCNCSTPQRTSESTQDANSATVNGGNHAPSVASSSLSMPNTGTSAPKDGHSTDVADRAISAGSLPINNGDAPASRFLYVPKASRRERNMGLPEGETSTHPTVKPLALMRYLIQMITPPGGIVLDPFAGSGSTLVAAAELGFHAIGIELSEEYAEIAARRVDHALNEQAKRLPGLEAAP